MTRQLVPAAMVCALVAALAGVVERSDQALEGQALPADPTTIAVVDGQPISAAMVLGDASPPLDDDHAKRLIESAIVVELAFREADRLDLMRNDAILRGRVMKLVRELGRQYDVAAIDEAELRAAWQADPDRFATAEAVAFDEIFVAPGEREKLDQAYAQLQAGADWDAVRAAVTRPPPIVWGDGQLPLHRLGREYGEPAAAALARTEVGAWSAPVTTARGAHIFRVRSRTPAAPRPFAAVRDHIEQSLRATREQQSLGRWVRAARHDARVWVVPDAAERLRPAQPQ